MVISLRRDRSLSGGLDCQIVLAQRGEILRDGFDCLRLELVASDG